MATCKECLHVDACLESDKDLICRDYKDSSRFVELPCKVGDRVYYIANVNGKDEINSAVVQKVTIHFENEVGYDCGIGEIGFSNRSIGKRVFLTEEQAKQALAKRNQPDNTPQ